MRAVRRAGDGVAVVEVPEPAGEGVRVRVRSAGICGSDLHMIAGGLIGETTIGHEIAGLAPDGTPVAVEPLSPCGACAWCERGDVNLCQLGAEIIHGVMRDGGMAEEILVPAAALVPLPAGLDVANASLVEPLAVAVHGLRRARLRGDERVAVVGAGTIGLCAVAVARSAGVEVALVARHEAQREAGARLGAVAVDGRYDLVVEAAGTAGALEQAVQLASPGGRVALLGSYWDPVEMPGFLLCLKEIDLVPASLYGRQGVLRDVEVATALLATRPEIAATLITHRFPLEAAPEAFATAGNRASGVIKVVLEP